MLPFFVTGSFICSVGIHDLPASVAGIISSLLASHILDSSIPSSHLDQCSAFALWIILEYQFCCWQYSLCIGWHLFSQWYFDLAPSCHIFFFASMSSMVHHLFTYGLGLVSLTVFLMVSFITSLRALSFVSNSLVESISVGGGMLAKFCFRIFVSSFQLASLKFGLGSHCVFSIWALISVTFRQWSVFGGQVSSSVLHFMTLSRTPSVKKMLLTLV